MVRGEFARVGKFLSVGFLNTFVGLCVIYLCKWLGKADDVVANLVGYAVALANSFVWNRRWTFRFGGAVWPAMLRFLAVFVVAYLLNLGTVLVAIHFGDVDSYVAHAIGIAPYTVFFYVGSRFFAFKQTSDPASERELEL